MIRDIRSQERQLKDKNVQEILWFWKTWSCFFRIFWFSLLVLTSQATFAVTVPAGDLAPYGTPDGQVNVADVLILQRMVNGDLIPTADELLIADVAPLGSPDGLLNAADVLILQRVVLGQVTLPDINLGPDAPTLTTPSGATNDNPFTVTGTASLGITVNLYVNGQQQTTITANPADGSFTFAAVLIDGTNDIYTTAWDGSDESGPSASISITYDNIISRTQSGTISTDTVWTPGSIPEPYIITGNLTVDTGVNFILQSGTTLQFDNGTQLTINGTLNIAGTALNPVTITSSSASPTRGIWGGIVIDSGATGVVIDNTVIEWASTAIEVNGAAGITISNNTIRNFGTSGISLNTGASGLISNNLIDNLNRSGYGIYLDQSSPTIQGNTIQNTNRGLYIRSNSAPLINGGNIITANQYGIYAYGDGTVGYSPNPTVNGNSIYGNLIYNYRAYYFYDAANVRLDATGNWWGSIDPSVIADNIYDNAESATRSPVVDFVPFLDGAGGSPVIDDSYLYGSISEDTTLLVDTTYTIVGNLTVPVGVILTIPAGVTLQFVNDAQLTADGILNITGTVLNPVTMTSSSSSPTRGIWRGIVINSTATNVVIDNTVIEWASRAIEVNGAADVTISNNTIRNFYYGIRLNAGASSLISNNLIDNNLYGQGDGIYLDQSSPTIQGNTIQNTNRGLYIRSNSAPLINGGNIITANQYGIYAYGNVTVGNNPNPTVNGNSIYDNVRDNYRANNFYDAANVRLDATGNWWGSIDPLVIAGNIYDYTENSTWSPAVDFTPFLDGAGGSLVTSYLSGPISEDTTLLVDTTYTVVDALIVPAGMTLTIPTGVTLEFFNDVQLTVNGTLNITGTALNPVTITSSSSSPTRGIWGGIVISSTATNVVIDNTVIEWAYYAIRVNGAADVTISNNTIRNFRNSGIRLFTGASGLISNNLIDNLNGQEDGIYLDQSSPTIQGNTIQNTNRGLYIRSNSAPLINGGNIITANQYGIYALGDSTAGYSPNPIVNGNSIYDNVSHNYYAYNFYDAANVRLDAAGNWWGSIDPLVIAGNIYDYTENSTWSPMVDFTPFLDGEGGSLVTSYLSGSISENTTLLADTTYTVVDALIVPAGMTLTIPTGVTLEFFNDVQLTVNGTLNIAGTAVNPVTLTSSSSSPTKGIWSGIVINSGATGVVIDYAVIEWSNYGINFNNSGTVGVVTNSLLRNNNRGVYIYLASHPVIGPGNEIMLNGYGLFVRGNNIAGNNPNPVVNGNQIHNNTFWNAYTNYYYDGGNVRLDMTGNYWGSTAPSVIAATISDYSDSTGLPVVDFSGYLDITGAVLGGDTLVGVFDTDTTLVAGTTYDVLGTLYIPAGVTLTIPAGVTLRFADGARDLVVAGNLLVQGTSGSQVTFTSSNLFNPVPAKGDWGGIIINSTATAIIEYAVIEYANKGVSFVNADGTLSNSLLQHNTYGIFIEGTSNPNILNNAVIDNTYGIYLQGTGVDTGNPQPVINGNDIYLNSSAQLYINNYGTTSTVSIDMEGNWWGTDIPSAGAGGEIQFGSNMPADPTVLVNYSNSLTAPSQGPGLIGVSVSELYFSPAISVGIKDTTTFTGTLTEPVDTWTVTVIDNLGAVIKTFPTGNGTIVNVTWDGTNDSAVMQADGRYRFVVSFTAGGRTSYPSYYQIVLDNTIPTAIISTPVNNDTLQNIFSIAIQGSVTDSNYVNYELDYGAGVAPSTYITISGVQTVQIIDNTLNTWQLVSEEDGTPYIANGDYTLRVRVTDKAGNTNSYTILVTLDNLVLVNITRSVSSFNAVQGESLAIGFDINLPVTVSLKVYPEQQGATGTPIRTISQVYTNSGTYAISWDGRDDAGNIVADEAYIWSLTATDGVRQARYSSFVGGGISGYGSGAIQTTYNAYQNDHWKINYTTDINGRVRLRVRTSSDVFYPIDSVPYEVGTHLLIWDGRDPAGNIITGSAAIWFFPPVSLVSNYVLVTGTTPQITGLGAAPNIEVKSNPYRVTHSYDQFSQIGYLINQDAYITIKLLPPGVTDINSPAAIMVVDNELQQAKDVTEVPIDHIVEWSGYNAGDTNNMLVTEEGTYTFTIEATGVVSGAQSLYRGALQLFH